MRSEKEGKEEGLRGRQEVKVKVRKKSQCCVEPGEQRSTGWRVDVWDVWIGLAGVRREGKGKD